MTETNALHPQRTAMQEPGRAPRRAGVHAAAAAAGLALSLLAGASVAQDIATLGDVKITAAEVRRLAQQRPDLRQSILGSEQGFENQLRNVLIQRAIIQEALAKGWDKRPDIAERIENAKNEVIVATWFASVAPLPANYPGDAEVNAAYEQNKARLFTPWSFHLAQIFVRRPPEQGKSDAAAKRAAQLAQKARAPGADFAALAKAESEDEASKAKGGDTGWVFEPSLLPELRGPLQRLKPGEVSEAVQSTQGWHIVKLVESRPPAPASLENARGSVVNELQARRLAETRQAYVDALIKKSPIKIDRAALAKLREELKK